MKKVLMLVVLVVSSLASMAQVGYSVSGTCPADAKKVFLSDLTYDYQVIDSALVQDGHFCFKGVADADALLGLGVDESTTVSIFFNDGQPVQADLTTGILHSSDVNNRLNQYDRRLDSISGVEQRLNEEMAMLFDEDDNPREGCEQAIMAMVQKYQALSLDEMGTYAAIMGETDNLIPVVYLEQLVTMCNALGNQEKKAELLSPERPYFQHPMGGQTIERILQEEQRQQLIGQPFIDLEEPDMDGRMHRLSDYCGKGNYVFVDFWASWCGPCMAEMPNVRANYEKYRAKGFQIVGLSFDQKAEAWKKAVRDKQLNWIHLSDLKGWQTIAAEVYDINSIPSSLLIDPEGKVVARDLRGTQLGDKLKEIYGF